MNSIRVALISSLGATLTAGCATGAPPANVSSTPPNIGRALQEVDASDFLKHIETLASDDFEGRSVGARGEAVTVDYLVGEFKRIGLMPGNPDGSYIQRVPLTEHTSAPSAIIKAGATRLDLKFPDDFVAWSCQGGRAVALRLWRRRLHRTTWRLRRKKVQRLRRPRLSQSHRCRAPGLEPIRSGRKYAAAVPGRLRRRAGRPVSRMESRGGVQSPARRDEGRPH